MNPLDNLYVRATNDIVHDLAAGLWPGAVLALAVMRGGLAGTARPDRLPVVLEAWYGVFWLAALAVAALVFTGAVRLRYRTMGIEPSSLPGRGRAATYKHVVFVSVFVLALAAAVVMLRT
jgi:putative copper export protein